MPSAVRGGSADLLLAHSKTPRVSAMGGIATPAPVLLISDTFTDTNSVDLASHTIAPTNIPATAWTVRAGTWQIQSNRGTTTTGAANGHATLNSGVGDVVITAKVVNNGSAGQANDSGIVVRWGSTNAFFRISINAADDVIRIVERAGGSNTVVATTSVTIATGTEYTIVVTCSGSTISATLDGANAVSYALATANQASGIHGIYARVSNDYIDSFTVTG